MTSNSSLTPGMRNLFQTSGSSESLRRLIEGCIRNGDSKTACTLADSLLQSEDAGIADVILFARCFFAASEYNRSLAVLEHEGLLSAQRIAEASDMLLASSSDLYSDDGLTENVKIQLWGLQAIHLAAKCLINLEQHEDCVNLIEPVLSLDTLDPNEGLGPRDDIIIRVQKVFSMMKNLNIADGLNVVASLYCMAGKCYDILENRAKAKMCLITALKVDVVCTEALSYLISHGLISLPDRRALFESIEGGLDGRAWLEKFHRFQLLDEFNIYKNSNSESGDNGDNAEDTRESSSILGLGLGAGGNIGDRGGSVGGSNRGFSSAMVLVRKAEKFFDKGYFSDSYRLARQAYIIDPFDEDGLIVYVGNMVELGLKTELFYLSHELVNSSPKRATSWYSVGCYYWVCRKLEHAQKYLQKTVKVDKRFSQAWVILGHVLAAQEESENAISAFRMAAKLLPSDPRPIVFMAKEQVRTNYLSLALHLLTSALRLCPSDPMILNELGVAYMKQNNLEKALEFLKRAAHIVASEARGASLGENESFLRESRTCGDEVGPPISLFLFLAFPFGIDTLLFTITMLTQSLLFLTLRDTLTRV